MPLPNSLSVPEGTCRQADPLTTALSAHLAPDIRVARAAALSLEDVVRR